MNFQGVKNLPYFVITCYSFVFGIKLFSPPGFAVKGISWRKLDKYSQFHTIQFGVKQDNKLVAALARNR